MAPLKLTNKDIDLIVRLVATEADHKLVWSHPEEYTQQVHGIVDTVLNRVASGHWGDSVASVANAKNQFSAINGPSGRGYKVFGSVDKVPDGQIPAFLPNIVNSWVTARRSGTPSSVGGNLNYANPRFSDAKNLDWINALDGPKLGYGKSIHYHGTVAGLKPVEAVLAPQGGTAGLQDIHDRNATARGFGELGPQPKTISPALQAARTRLATARQYQQLGVSKATSAGMTPAGQLQVGSSAERLSDPLKVGAAGLSATPRLPNGDPATVTEAQRQAAIANVPRMDMSSEQARALVLDEGFGSLLGPRSVSPSAITRPPTSTNANLNLARSEQGAQRLAPMAAAPAAPVPLPREARPQAQAPAQTTSSEPRSASPQPMVRLDSGKMAKVGDTAVIGGKLWTVQDSGNGTGKLVKTETGLLNEINSNTVAGGVVREKVGEAIGGGTRTIADAAKPVLDTVTKAGGDLLGQAGNFLGGLFGGGSVGPADSGLGIKLSVPLDKPKAGTTLAIPPAAAGNVLSANANLNAARNEQAIQRGRPPFMEIAPPIPATMPPGLRGNALPTTPKANPITVSRPQASPASQPTPKLYQAGGYVYAANPQGGYTKVGKVGSPSVSSGGSSGGSSSSSSSVSTAGLRPGDRTYNADTNEWVVK